MADIGLSFLQPIALQQKMDLEAQRAPVDLLHTLATTRYNTAMADRLEEETAGERRAAELMAQQIGEGGEAGAGAAGNFSDMLMQQARIFAKSGMPVKAQAALQAAATASMHEQMRAQAQTRIGMAQSAQTLKRATLAANVLADVQDQDGWDQANRVIEAQTGQPSPFKDIPYDPKTVEYLRNQAIGAKGAAQLAIQEENLRSKIADRQSAMRHRAALEGLEADKLQLQKDREARLTKAGGKDVGSPQARDVDYAKRVLRNQPGLVSEEDLPLAASDLASAALAKRKSNPGIDMGEALQQALQEKLKAGDFTPGQPMTLGGFTVPFTGGAAKYEPARPLPKKKADLVVGQKYRDETGAVGRWDGQKFQPLGKPGGKPAASSRRSSGTVVDETPDDEEEE